MTPERFEEIGRLYHAALELEPGQRAAFLDQACAGDPELRREIESLLTAHAQAGDFITVPALKVMGTELATSQRESQVGRTIGPYQILSFLGAGGMGEVYLAEDTRLGRKVALKLLPRAFTEDPERVKRLEREARAASSLTHPNIITVLDIGQTEGVHFIVTEYIAGQTLRARLAGGPMRLPALLGIAIEIATALAAAHDAGLIHRDIKTENVMVRDDGYVKVLDFGLAKLTERDPAGTAAAWSETSPGVIMGTLDYMSPEQARGEVLDSRSDIFSLGVVLYEMVAGKTPFGRPTSAETISAILRDEPAPQGQHRNEVPEELERIVAKALRKNREERYQHVTHLLLDLQILKHQLEFEAALDRTRQERPSEVLLAAEGAGDQVLDSSASRVAAASERPSAGPLTSVLAGSRARAVGIGLLGLAVLLLGGVALYLWLGRAYALNSVAVLPFANTNLEPDAEYLSDGITESLINRLSRLPTARVIARTTVFRFKGQPADPVKIGADLEVDAVLSGRIALQGEVLTVQAELVRVADGSQIWGERYTGKLSDLQSVEEEISGQISERLAPRLTEDHRYRPLKRYTENTETYHSYLRGRYYWNKRTAEGLKKAIEHFQTAIQRDPAYAPAYAGLADCYALLTYYEELPPQEWFPLAKQAATRALAIDESLSEAHTSLAFVLYRFEWDWPAAEREFLRAIELNPSYATAHHWYGEYLENMDRLDEAILEFNRARKIDPLSLIISLDETAVLRIQGRYDEAIERYRKILDMDPNFVAAYRSLGSAYEQKGDYGEAISTYLKALALSGATGEKIAALRLAYSKSGIPGYWRAQLQELLEERGKRRYVSPYNLARIYARLGEREKAFTMLNEAIKDRSYGLVFLKMDPSLASLRSDHRFTALVRRIGLTR